MDTRGRVAFLVLVLAQSAHSLEEYLFRLHDVFGPARFVSGLVSDDLTFGFALVNVGIVLFGIWCYVARVRPGHASAGERMSAGSAASSCFMTSATARDGGV